MPARRPLKRWNALTRILGRCPGFLKPKDDAFILAEFLSTEHRKALEQAHCWMRCWEGDGVAKRAFLGMKGRPNFKDAQGKP